MAGGMGGGMGGGGMGYGGYRPQSYMPGSSFGGGYGQQGGYGGYGQQGGYPMGGQSMGYQPTQQFNGYRPGYQSFPSGPPGTGGGYPRGGELGQQGPSGVEMGPQMGKPGYGNAQGYAPSPMGGGKGGTGGGYPRTASPGGYQPPQNPTVPWQTPTGGGSPTSGGGGVPVGGGVGAPTTPYNPTVPGGGFGPQGQGSSPLVTGSPGGGYGMGNINPADVMGLNDRRYGGGIVDSNKFQNNYWVPYLQQLGQQRGITGQQNLWNLMGANGGLNGVSASADWALPGQDAAAQGFANNYTGFGNGGQKFVNGHLFTGSDADYINYWNRFIPQ